MGGVESKPKGKGKKGKDDKGKGKGKRSRSSGSSRGSARSSSVGSDNSKRPLCAWFAVGKCQGGCGYLHELPQTQRMKKRLEDLRNASGNRSRSPSPAARKPPCHSWQKTGTCKFGKECRFSHDSAPPTGSVAPVKPGSDSGKIKSKSKKKGSKQKKGNSRKSRSSSSASSSSSAA